MSDVTDLVYLTVEPDDGGELVRRADLPADATRASFDVEGEQVENGEPGRTYEVFVIARV